jgi:hypothetical protein
MNICTKAEKHFIHAAKQVKHGPILIQTEILKRGLVDVIKEELSF